MFFTECRIFLTKVKCGCLVCLNQIENIENYGFPKKSSRPDGVPVQDQVSSGPSPGVYQSPAKKGAYPGSGLLRAPTKV